MTLAHLDRLEAESIFIFREVVAEVARPVLLYSVGKDSAVMLRLAQKAFAPEPIPFPCLHIASGWDFADVLRLRDAEAARLGLDLRVHREPGGVTPFCGDPTHYVATKLTAGLRNALEQGGYQAAFGGARRDEERARAKERIVSVRGPRQRWDAERQRPELWNLYTCGRRAGESLRVFPLSNWTEADVWRYIAREALPVVPLYFAAPRPVVRRDDLLIMVDDARLPLRPGEQVEVRSVRFRTLGCYPLTGAIESRATTPAAVLAETLAAAEPERAQRGVDRDQPASMERKKVAGYF